MAVTGKLGTSDSLLGNILLGDQVVNILTTTDNPTVSESASIIVTKNVTATDAPTVSESLVAIVTKESSTTDNPTISESLERTGSFYRVTTDAPVLSEAVDWVAILARSTSDAPTISEEATASKTFLRNTTDAPTISESILVGFSSSKTTTDASTISEETSILKTLFKSLSNTLTIDQSVSVTTPYQVIEQSLTITQTVVSEGEFAKNASNSLSIIQSADYFQFKPIEVESTLTLDQDVDVVQTTGFSNTLTITQDAVYQYDPHIDTPFQALTPEQTVTVAAIFNRTISQPLTLVQTVGKLRIVEQSIVSTLGIYQTLTGGPVRNASNTLDDLDHQVDVEVFRNKSVSQSLQITHSVGLQMILNRSLTSTLVFKNEHAKPDGAGNFIYIPNLIYTKGGIDFGNCGCPVGRATTVFESGSRSLILPNPEYNDTEGLVAAVSVKRTITGGTFSYVKKSASRKLKYRFIISQRKAYEVRRFLLDFLGSRITMTNWKGEMWSGFILTNPAEIISTSRGGVCTGDLFEVNLEYQGVRVN